MIVCLCHRVSDRDIHAAVKDGTTCFEVLQDELLVAASCGACHDCAREVFDAACGPARALNRIIPIVASSAAASASAS